jgi:hypothetical protein
MKYFLLIFIVISSLTSINAKAETETTCVRNASGEIIVAAQSNVVTDTDGNLGDACQEIPDVYRLQFYKVGLCTADPLASVQTDYSSCSFFLDSTSASVLDITMPASSSLPITSLPAIGTYGYMVLLISNALQLQHTEVFSANVTGSDGVAGKYCSTNSNITSYSGFKTLGVIGNPVNPTLDNAPGVVTTLGMTCGSTAPTAQFTTEYMDNFADDPSSDFVADTPGAYTLTGGTMKGRLTQVDNTTTATSANNSERLAVVFTFTAPQTVTSASQYDLNFKIQDSVSVDLSYHSDTSTIYAIKSGANPFQIYMGISN